MNLEKTISLGSDMNQNSTGYVSEDFSTGYVFSIEGYDRNVSEANIILSFRSDHSVVTLSIKCNWRAQRNKLL